MRRSTQSRIGLGRSGDALPTTRVLEFGTAHAAARDAVHTPLDAQALAGRIDGLGLGAPLLVTSRATDRSEYLRRPDSGRAPADGALDVLPGSGGDIGIVLADGLSPRALDDHGVPLLQALHRRLRGYAIAPLVVATQAQVALGDHIGAALGVDTVLVLIGERRVCRSRIVSGYISRTIPSSDVLMPNVIACPTSTLPKASATTRPRRSSLLWWRAPVRSAGPASTSRT